MIGFQQADKFPHYFVYNSLKTKQILILQFCFATAVCAILASAMISRSEINALEIALHGRIKTEILLRLSRVSVSSSTLKAAKTSVKILKHKVQHPLLEPSPEFLKLCEQIQQCSRLLFEFDGPETATFLVKGFINWNYLLKGYVASCETLSKGRYLITFKPAAKAAMMSFYLDHNFQYGLMKESQTTLNVSLFLEIDKKHLRSFLLFGIFEHNKRTLFHIAKQYGLCPKLEFLNKPKVPNLQQQLAILSFVAEQDFTQQIFEHLKSSLSTVGVGINVVREQSPECKESVFLFDFLEYGFYTKSEAENYLRATLSSLGLSFDTAPVFRLKTLESIDPNWQLDQRYHKNCIYAAVAGTTEKETEELREALKQYWEKCYQEHRKGGSSAQNGQRMSQGRQPQTKKPFRMKCRSYSELLQSPTTLIIIRGLSFSKSRGFNDVLSRLEGLVDKAAWGVKALSVLKTCEYGRFHILIEFESEYAGSQFLESSELHYRSFEQFFAPEQRYSFERVLSREEVSQQMLPEFQRLPQIAEYSPYRWLQEGRAYQRAMHSDQNHGYYPNWQPSHHSDQNHGYPPSWQPSHYSDQNNGYPPSWQPSHHSDQNYGYLPSWQPGQCYSQQPNQFQGCQVNQYYGYQTNQYFGAYAQHLSRANHVQTPQPYFGEYPPQCWQPPHNWQNVPAPQKADNRKRQL